MSAVRSNGVTTFSVVPSYSTVGNNWPTFGKIGNTNQLVYKNGDSWVSFKVPLSEHRTVISQASTDAPTGVVVSSSLSETPTFVYNDVGDYELHIVGTSFTSGKTIVQATIHTGATGFQVKANATTTSHIAIKVYDAAGAPVDLGGSIDLTIEVF